MNRDDRLFAIIGGTVVTAAATLFLVYASGITGTIEDRPVVGSASTVSVEPVPPSTHEDSSAGEPASARADGIVRAENPSEATGVGSDVLAAMVAGVSAHPQWASWLVTDDLLVRFVNAVEAVADGYSPTDELGFVADRGPFLVREDGDRLVIAAGTFRRYSLAVDVLGSIDADRAVEVFRALEPEIEEIRLGTSWHRGSFEDRLREAVDQLLAVRVPDGVVEVERRRTSYAFAEDEFEHLSGAQQHLLRMGGANARKLQGKLRELRDAFGWPEAPTDPPVRLAVDTEIETPADEPVVVADASFVDEVPVEPMLTPLDPRVAGFPFETSPLVAPPAVPAAP